MNALEPILKALLSIEKNSFADIVIEQLITRVNWQHTLNTTINIISVRSVNTQHLEVGTSIDTPKICMISDKA